MVFINQLITGGAHIVWIRMPSYILVGPQIIPESLPSNIRHRVTNCDHYCCMYFWCYHLSVSLCAGAQPILVQLTRHSGARAAPLRGNYSYKHGPQEDQRGELLGETRALGNPMGNPQLEVWNGFFMQNWSKIGGFSYVWWLEGMFFLSKRYYNSETVCPHSGVLTLSYVRSKGRCLISA